MTTVLQGHGDPLQLEVMAGLEQMPHDETTKTCTCSFTSGERHYGTGDPLFDEVERYHQDKSDNVGGVTQNLALHERLVKRDKNNSLSACHISALYDPFLHECVLPRTKLSELKDLEVDVAHKRDLFREMSGRKKLNLNERELYCDPLVHSYRMHALSTSKPAYCKLDHGDPLFNATQSQA